MGGVLKSEGMVRKAGSHHFAPKRSGVVTNSQQDVTREKPASLLAFVGVGPVMVRYGCCPQKTSVLETALTVPDVLHCKVFACAPNT